MLWHKTVGLAEEEGGAGGAGGGEERGVAGPGAVDQQGRGGGRLRAGGPGRPPCAGDPGDHCPLPRRHEAARAADSGPSDMIARFLGWFDAFPSPSFCVGRRTGRPADEIACTT